MSRHEFDIPDFPQQSIWESLTEVQPLHLQARDRQQWALAMWGIEKPKERLVYFQEALTDSHWVEILEAYRAGNLADIGYIFDQAIRNREMCDRVDKDELAEPAVEDPTPWCSYGHKTESACDCGPIAENE